MMRKQDAYRIGVISDTHGILQPQVLDLFARCDQIIHAGDIDTPDLLTRLKQVAPVTAVRGNMDGGKWAAALPVHDIVTVGQVSIYVLHDVADLDLDPSAAGIQVVISGHTHRASRKKQGGVLYINPGSAGAPRSSRRPSVAVLSVNGPSVAAEFTEW